LKTVMPFQQEVTGMGWRERRREMEGECEK
jgi:hypothetical protein